MNELLLGVFVGTDFVDGVSVEGIVEVLHSLVRRNDNFRESREGSKLGGINRFKLHVIVCVVRDDKRRTRVWPNLYITSMSVHSDIHIKSEIMAGILRLLYLEGVGGRLSYIESDTVIVPSSGGGYGHR